MTKFEFEIVPMPERSLRLDGLSRRDDRFSATLAHVINDKGSEGWEFVRSETIRVRTGQWPLRRRMAKRQFLVFRRDPQAGACDMALVREEMTAGAEEKRPPQVQPRRVRSAQAVAEALAGNRKISVIAEAPENQDQIPTIAAE